VRAEALRQQTEPGSLVVIANGWERVYVPYFGMREPFYISWYLRDCTAASAMLSRTLMAGTTVYLLPEVAEDVRWQGMLALDFDLHRHAAGAAAGLYTISVKGAP